MNSEQIIETLGGSSEVARLCECSPQAVSQWFGRDPITGIEREIPKARLMYLKAIRPDVFKVINKQPNQSSHASSSIAPEAQRSSAETEADCARPVLIVPSRKGASHG